MSKYLSEALNLRVGIEPAADRWSSNPTSDYFDLSEYESISFYVVQAEADGTTANPTVTIQAASDVSGTGATAIAFKSRKQTVTGAVGSLTETSASGIALDAGDDQTLIAEVKSADLPDAKPFVSGVGTEGANEPATGAVFGVMGGPRHTDGNPSAAVS